MKPNLPRARRRVTLLREIHEQRKKLGQQEERLLWLLLRTPFLAVSDLATLLQCEQTSVYNHIHQLSKNGLIEACRAPDADVNRRLFMLSNSGLHLLASLIDRDPFALATTTHTDEYSLLELLPRLQRLAQVQAFLFDLLKQAPRVQHQEEQQLQWFWKRDVLIPGIESEFPCIDASLTWSYHPQAEWYTVLVILETDLFLREAMTRKIESVFSSREQERRSFPPVLLLTSRPEQQQIWSEEMRMIAQRRRVTPLTGASLVLASQLPRASVWEQEWKLLAEPRSCVLPSVVKSVPASQVPTFLFDPDLVIPTGLFPHSAPLTVITGQFSERARRAMSDPMREGESELALLSLCLGTRHQGILGLLSHLPLLSTKELGCLLTCQSSSVQHYLRELGQQNIVDFIQFGRTRRWWVTARGLRLLALTHRLPAGLVQSHAIAVLGTDISTLTVFQQQKRAAGSCPTEPCLRLISFGWLLVKLHQQGQTFQDRVRLRWWGVEPLAPLSAMQIDLEVRRADGWQPHHLQVIWVSRSRTPTSLESVKRKLEALPTASNSAVVLVTKNDLACYQSLESNDVRVMTPGALRRSTLPFEDFLLK